MNKQSYTITLDINSGPVSFNHVVVRADSRPDVIEREMRSLPVRISRGDEHEVHYQFGRGGKFVGVPCGAGLVCCDGRVKFIAIVLDAELQLVGRMLHQELGIILHGQPERGAPLYSLCFLLNSVATVTSALRRRHHRVAVYHIFNATLRHTRIRPRRPFLIRSSRCGLRRIR